MLFRSHLQLLFKEYFWSESSQDSVHSCWHGRPLIAPSCFLCPELLLPGSPTRGRELVPVSPPLCSGNALGQCFCSLQRELGGTPLPPHRISCRLWQRHAPRHCEPPPHSVHHSEAASLSPREFPFLARSLAPAQPQLWPVPQGRMGGPGSPGWGLGWKMVVPGRSVLMTRARAPARAAAA